MTSNSHLPDTILPTLHQGFKTYQGEYTRITNMLAAGGGLVELLVLDGLHGLHGLVDIDD